MTDRLGDALRLAAGRRKELHAHEQAEPPVGDIGIGRGGTARPPRRRDDFDVARFNASLRAEAGYLRGRVTLDDLLDS